MERVTYYLYILNVATITQEKKIKGRARTKNGITTMKEKFKN